MIDVIQTKVAALYHENATKRPSAHHGAKKREIKLHDLGKDTAQFLDVVVESVKQSVDAFQVQEYW